jgi:hypothetical protein
MGRLRPSGPGVLDRQSRKNKWKGLKARLGCLGYWAEIDFGPLRENRKALEFSFSRFELEFEGLNTNQIHF